MSTTRSGTILHYDSTTWRRQHLGTEILYGVGGTARNDVFAFGAGVLFHYDGVAWSKMILPAQIEVRALTIREHGEHLETMFTGTSGTVMTLDRTRAASETQCIDGWDDDRDGAVDCADRDCKDAIACRSGGSCTIVDDAVCNTMIPGTTFTGLGRIDSLPGIATGTAGGEASYAFVAPANGRVTITLDGLANAEIVVLATYTDTAACNLDTAIAAGSGTPRVASFDAVAGSTYVIVVDTPLGSSGDFTLDVACSP